VVAFSFVGRDVESYIVSIFLDNDNDNLRSGFEEAQNIKPFLIQNNNMWDIIQLLRFNRTRFLV